MLDFVSPAPDSLPVANDTILAPELPANPDPLRTTITAVWMQDETEAIRDLIEQARLPGDMQADVQARAAELVVRLRERTKKPAVIEAFMHQYDLSSDEGILLMCVAEALLRIPDQDTADRLIRDKLGEADWEKHLGESDSLLVNASTWGLLLGRRMVRINDHARQDPASTLQRLAAKMGEPMIRAAVRQAMKLMGRQFVMGRTIKEGLAQTRKRGRSSYRYSFDMLGEAVLTRRDARRYMDTYRNAIRAIGKTGPFGNVITAPSISIKLSALFPRYEHAQRARVIAELTPLVLNLAQLAKSYGMGCMIDAEEADRLELSLDVIEASFLDASLEDWEGYGLAVQAYQKRAPYVIDWIVDLARRAGRRIPVRLVKGAYWDSEIKRAQIDGYIGYPVFTRKQNTDIAYLACVKQMFEYSDAIYPMFATHNAHTIASIPAFAQGRPYELQKLHGMGDDLYDIVLGDSHWNAPCRIYAPIGTHEDLLPYLVRRLLENGANSSFINLVGDDSLTAEDLARNPIETVADFETIPHPRIPLPSDLYSGPSSGRRNSIGINLADDHELYALAEQTNADVKLWTATPLVPGAPTVTDVLPVTNPANHDQIVGHWRPAGSSTVEKALQNAVATQSDWSRTPVNERCRRLEHAANMLERRLPEFVALCIKEAGKTIADSIAEVREAVDFLRYYASHARQALVLPEVLPGPTGELNSLQLEGRGTFVCISPWNFPLAVFLGQISAALVCGNTVIAKPAEQTNLIGYNAIRLLHEVGVPETVLQFVPGDGPTIGAALTHDPRVAGVAFTGSTETAHAINRSLAARNCAIATLIAETGGQNALIADSSALPEQLVKDAITSAFTSAGQRCSAARILYVQDDIAERVIEMLAGAMAELKIGDPGLLSTDIGPVIDENARSLLQAHTERMEREARWIATAPMDSTLTANGCFFAPRAFELESPAQLQHETFGPILHLVRWKAGQLDDIIDAINATGYGLTLGIHSRIDTTINHIVTRAKVGNIYVNRHQIGAVVGVQPFGGQGLSGTGPKAGGPHYLLRFVTEKAVSINTTASGGNASLLTLDG
ncbi:MAG: bifunctional proline dehydrogenase/L-glutamate gamma-semialdehyde dehydrogenase PutA [Xanthomonadaceae bacterium]|jgi:RHH-type proline utilization regulon transcriptional repressor/proline dehydrogenase/delta 1-pyrroline-5-carboxylate dehydrogenase|nr:bifunctional proline dehydrogenase/L-glutamate gamma-semialdehyde dehydrogenase PutA [Xanthomonadaceae bacterium]